MLAQVLDYSWKRNQVINAILDAMGYNDSLVEGSVPYARAENLSQRITTLVMGNAFDKDRANLMLAREVAYWREWLEEAQEKKAVEREELEKIHATIAALASFSFE